MLLRQFFKTREKRKRFAHIGAAVVIFIHAYEKFDHHNPAYIPFTIAGIIFLTVALLHPVIEKKAPWVDGVFFVIEGILSVIVAVDFFNAGKKALPVTYLLLAIFQFFMAFRKSKKGIEAHKNHETVAPTSEVQ
jgi:intracellular septation protein A